jgi:hypothetical protein
MQHDVMPEFSGPPERVLTLLAALPDLRPFIRHVHWGDGEVSVQLHPMPRCAGARMAQRCFEDLRHRLPDTDIYVTLS